MNEKEKNKLIAEAENVDALREFFTEWWTVEQLYETAAKATAVMLQAMNHRTLSPEDRDELQELMEQHLMMIERMKPFAGKEDEV